MHDLFADYSDMHFIDLKCSTTSPHAMLTETHCGDLHLYSKSATCQLIRIAYNGCKKSAAARNLRLFICGYCAPMLCACKGWHSDCVSGGCWAPQPPTYCLCQVWDMASGACTQTLDKAHNSTITDMLFWEVRMRFAPGTLSVHLTCRLPPQPLMSVPRRCCRTTC